MPDGGGISLSAAASPLLCAVTLGGSVRASAQGGVPPYGWYWQGSPVISPGEYRLTLTDAWGCEVVWALPLSQPDSLLASGAVISPASDSAAADGSVSVTAAGGTLPYTGLWSNGQPGLSATGIAPGTYMLTLTDARDCSFTASYAVGVTSSAGDPATQATVQVWPNPFRELLVVAYAMPSQRLGARAVFRLYDALGRMEQEWSLAEGVQELQVKALPAGVYFWEVSLGHFSPQTDGQVLQRGRLVREQ